MFSKFLGTDSFMDMLGTPSFWFTIVLIFGFIAVFVFCIKYWKQGGGWAIFSLFTIVLVVITGYSIINLNAYYNSKGGIYGAITGIFNTNEVEIVSDVEYSFSNIELVQVGDSDVYSATITLPEVFELSNGQDYMVYVNNMPCKYEENASDYVLADYGYVFYDDDFNALMEDTLHFRFAFYTNSTSLKVSTYGGAEAVRYWNYYFNKNTFVVKLAEVDGINISGDINFAEGDVSNYCTVTYMVGDTVSAVQVYTKGQTLNLLDINNSNYNRWTLNGQIVSSDYIVEENIELKAEKFNSINFISGNVTVHSILMRDGYITEGIINPVKENYEFVGWSIDGEDVLNYQEYLITSDVDFVALFGYWETMQNPYFSLKSLTVENYDSSFSVTANISEYFEECYGFTFAELTSNQFEICFYIQDGTGVIKTFKVSKFGVLYTSAESDTRHVELTSDGSLTFHITSGTPGLAIKYSIYTVNRYKISM